MGDAAVFLVPSSCPVMGAIGVLHPLSPSGLPTNLTSRQTYCHFTDEESEAEGE